MSKDFHMDGYVCGKIETRTTKNGKQITTFSVNSPKRVKNYDKWESVPQFFPCKYWHKFDNDFRADQIVDKAHLYITGEPDYEEWESNGQKRSRVAFNVRELFRIAPKDAAPRSTEQTYTEPSGEPEFYDEDIPF